MSVNHPEPPQTEDAAVDAVLRRAHELIVSRERSGELTAQDLADVHDELAELGRNRS